jgi:hypothetical protein
MLGSKGRVWTNSKEVVGSIGSSGTDLSGLEGWFHNWIQLSELRTVHQKGLVFSE